MQNTREAAQKQLSGGGLVTTTSCENSANSESSRNLELIENETRDLVDQIKSSYRRAQQRAGEWIEEVKNCGAALIKMKKKVPHGQWGLWLRNNFPGSQDTAENYMRIAANWLWLETEVSERPDAVSVDRFLKLVRMHESRSPRDRYTKMLQKALLRSIEKLDDRALEVLANAARDERCLLDSFFGEVIAVAKMLRTNDPSLIVRRGLSSHQVLMLALEELSPEIEAHLPVKIRDYLREWQKWTDHRDIETSTTAA